MAWACEKKTGNIKAIAEIMKAGKHPRGRHRLRWRDIIRRDQKVWNIRDERATDSETERCLQDPLPRTGRRWRKVRT